MIVNEEKGLFWCFTCNSGGDIFSFVQNKKIVIFQKRFAFFFQKAGIAVQEFSSGKKKQEEDTKERLFQILEEATSF